MGEVNKRTESDGRDFFIIRKGEKITKYEGGEWVLLLPGVVVRPIPDGIRLKRRIKP